MNALYNLSSIVKPWVLSYHLYGGRWGERKTNKMYSVTTLLIYSVFMAPIVFLGNIREYKTVHFIMKVNSVGE